MARIGYARVSTIDQNLDRQLELLQDTERVFQESISGVKQSRPELVALLDFIREGVPLVAQDRR